MTHRPARGPKENKLLDAFDGAQRAWMNRENDLVYAQGLADGIMLATWVERVRQGKELI